MTPDIEVLRAWIRVAVLIAAIGATSVPVVYVMTPWRSRPIGRVIMLQAVVLAAAIDLSAMFSFWAPTNILVIFWINAIILSAIAISTSSLAYMIWKLNRSNRKKIKVKFTSPVYDVLKKIAQIYLPAAGTLYFTLAQIWGLPAAEQVSGTVLALNTFLGMLLGISSAQYEKTGRFDGTVLIETDEEDGTSTLRIPDISRNALATQDEITLKVVHKSLPN